MDLRLLICRLIITFAFATLTNGSELANSSSATSLAPNEARKPTHCIATPQNLSFCNSKLGWAPTMAVPNLLGQGSENELVAMLNDLPIVDLANVNCKASQNLKLLMCSVVAPVCLDVVVQPCRHLCMSVKSNCESAMRRQGLEWPKFLDCRRFPSGSDSCLRRQPIVDTNATAPTNISDTMTTLEVTQEQNSANVYSVSPRKRKGGKVKGNRRTSSTTSTTTAAPSSSTVSSTSSEEAEEENLVTSAQQTQTTLSAASTTELDLPTTKATKTTTTTIPPPSSTTSGPTSTDEPVSTQLDTSSIPISISDSLAQVLCSTSPEWLIKTKISDTQLLNAASKRKLKVRSYRQIFGLLPNNDANLNNSSTRAMRNNKADNTTSTSSSLYLTITNSTLFTAAMGPNIYTQPLSDALPKNGQIETQPGSKSVRYYLVAGSGLPGGPGKVSASMLVVWPTTRFPTNRAGSQGSQNIINTYRDLKRRGAQVCQDSSGTMNLNSNRTDQGSSVNMTGADLTLTTSSTQLPTVAFESNQTQRQRKNKGKRVHPPSD